MYSNVAVGNEADFYRINFSFKTGTKDELTPHNGKTFSTFDKDTDESPPLNCAQLFKTGWWFKDCSSVKEKYGPRRTDRTTGMQWKNIKTIEMKLRRPE